MKRILSLILALALVILSGAALAETADAPALEAGMFEGPVLLTSVGQSADVNIVNTLMSKAGVEDVRRTRSRSA